VRLARPASAAQASSTLGLGTWGLEPGAWNLGLGTWGLEPGAWNLGLGTWGLEPGAWNRRGACRRPSPGSAGRASLFVGSAAPSIIPGLRVSFTISLTAVGAALPFFLHPKKPKKVPNARDSTRATIDPVNQGSSATGHVNSSGLTAISEHFMCEISRSAVFPSTRLESPERAAVPITTRSI
jgi:hypothetical protein